MLLRTLALPERPENSFFLWGPRQTGKTSLLRTTYPKAIWIDLLKSDDYARYLQRPFLLREELLNLPARSFVIIDEVQKLPMLLDEVHWLIENKYLVFGLCGSSARKVRRGHANLLGGRALRYELFGLTSTELKESFDITRIVNHGYLPRHYLSENPEELLRSYVGDYLKEEIAAEGLVRNFPAFADFLEKASLSDGQIVNHSNIARECGVSLPTVQGYFSILVDTLLGRWLPAYRHRPKRRVILAPKFYFADVGVVNHLAKRGRLLPSGELFGQAFENWVFHEIYAYREYSRSFYDLSYWRLAAGTEVDFIFGKMEVAVEAKSASKIVDHHIRGLRTLREDHPNVKKQVCVCLEKNRRTTSDGIDILPTRQFVEQLWSGELLDDLWVG